MWAKGILLVAAVMLISLASVALREPLGAWLARDDDACRFQLNSNARVILDYITDDLKQPIYLVEIPELGIWIEMDKPPETADWYSGTRTVEPQTSIDYQYR
jgi:hypothetical protein